MSKKTKTKTETHNVTTPTNPAWVDSSIQGLSGQIGALASADPYSFTAGADPLQTQAGQGAASLTSSPNFGQASGILNGVAGAGPNLSGGPASLLDNLQAYMSPYTNDVVNTSLADYDYGAGQTQAQNKLSLAGDTTFGGSGGAIQTSLSNDAITRGRGALSAGLRDQAFNTGANLSNLDAARRQQSSQFDAGQKDNDLQRQIAAALGLTSTGTAQGEDTRANIGTQASIGDMLRQIQATHNLAPLSLLSTQAGLAGSLPYGLFHGETSDGTSTQTSKTSDPVGSIGSLALGLGALAGGGALLPGLSALGGGGAGLGAIVSDRRLKRDVVKLGERPDGLGVYLYRYLWSPMLHAGVMAQEVLKVKPSAVITMTSGFYAVDYGKL